MIVTCDTKKGRELLDELRERLTEAERLLLNPRLLVYTRRQLERRAELLRFEVQELTHPTPFRESGSIGQPKQPWGNDWGWL